VLSLLSGWCYMLLARRGLFGWARAGRDTPSAAVIADAVHRDVIVDHRLVVGVVHHRDIHVGDRPVIDESSASPISPGIPRPCVAETIVYSAIEPDVRSPVSGVPNVL